MQSAKRGKELTRDEVYQIMTRMTIEDVQSLCLSNKKYHHLCNNHDFWILLFKEHELKIYNYQDTMLEWINEYTRVSNASKEADDMMEMIDKADIKTINVFNNTPVTMITPKNAFFIYIKPNDVEMDKKHYDYAVFRQLLIDMLYHYPNIRLGANYRYHNIPLRKAQLLKDMQYQNQFGKTVFKEFYDLY